MSYPHIAAMRYVITPENYEGWITIRSGLDGTVRNSGVARYRQLNSVHLEPHTIERVDKNTIHLAVKTSTSDIVISEACKTHIYSRGREISSKSKVVTREKKAIYQDFDIYVKKNQEYEVEKTVAIYTSKDKDILDTRESSIGAVTLSHRFDELMESHKKAWYALWKKFDIDIQGDLTFRKVMRLHIFHLLQSICETLKKGGKQLSLPLLTVPWPVFCRYLTRYGKAHMPLLLHMSFPVFCRYLTRYGKAHMKQ